MKDYYQILGVGKDADDDEIICNMLNLNVRVKKHEVGCHNAGTCQVGNSTAKDVLKSLCKAIPVAGAWCDDAFKLAQELISGGSCSAITCDCENVGGGLMRGGITFYW